MPNCLKMAVIAVIEKGVVVRYRDVLDLYRYFYLQLHLWGLKAPLDLSRDEVREMLERAC